ncbi:MAG: hypothetical protein WKF96_13070 [Solirubrobacteraceae bacterium]
MDATQRPQSLRTRLRAQREITELRGGYVRGRAELAQLRRGSRPIVAGPFVSEVGFECLYWIPLLRWLVERQGIKPERVVAFSRGGPASWYADVADRYVDVFDHLAPAQLKERGLASVAGTRNEKQFAVGTLDRELLERAGLKEGFALLHPSLMYRMFWSFWAGRRAIGRVLDHVEFAPFAPAQESADARAILAELPEEYVAVKPYFSRCLPETPANHAFVAALLERLAATHEVVLLDAGADLDEHSLHVPDLGRRVHDLGRHVPVRDNLEIQSAVVRHSSALYTTYGGFAHLGPFLGAPTFAFFSDASFNPAHLDVMSRAVTALRKRTGAGFVLGHVDDLALVDRLARGTLGQAAR